MKLAVLQEDVVRAVTYRESLLVQLTGLVTSWPSKRQKGAIQLVHTPYPEAVRLLRNLSK